MSCGFMLAVIAVLVIIQFIVLIVHAGDNDQMYLAGYKAALRDMSDKESEQ